jgi:hypothetical protein
MPAFSTLQHIFPIPVSSMHRSGPYVTPVWRRKRKMPVRCAYLLHCREAADRSASARFRVKPARAATRQSYLHLRLMRFTITAEPLLGHENGKPRPRGVGMFSIRHGYKRPYRPPSLARIQSLSLSSSHNYPSRLPRSCLSCPPSHLSRSLLCWRSLVLIRMPSAILLE